MALGVAPYEPWFKGVKVGEKEKWDSRRELPKATCVIFLLLMSYVVNLYSSFVFIRRRFQE